MGMNLGSLLFPYLIFFTNVSINKKSNIYAKVYC